MTWAGCANFATGGKWASGHYVLESLGNSSSPKTKPRPAQKPAFVELLAASATHPCECIIASFSALQDYTNYDIRVHHTNTDTVERVEMQDIRQAALAAAWFAYSAAQADRKMPRPAAR